MNRPMQALINFVGDLCAVVNWRQIALGPKGGLHPYELDDYSAACEHEQVYATAGPLKR